jgi:hypothetical protein
MPVHTERSQGRETTAMEALRLWRFHLKSLCNLTLIIHFPAAFHRSTTSAMLTQRG